MVLRQSLQNKYSYVYRKATCMQKRSFYLKQNKMAKTHSCSNRIIHGHIYVHPQEIVRQIFAQIVPLGQITNIIYHVYISNNKNKRFSPQNRLSFIFRSSDSTLLLFTLAHAYGPRQANLCLRAFRHDKF